MKKTAGILFILLLMLTVFAGCATTPELKKTGEAVFYPPLPTEPRIQFLKSISSEFDLGQKRSAFEEFIMGTEPATKLGKPYDVGASKGKIYVMDSQYNKIVVIDLVSKDMFLLKDTREGRLINASGIWVSADDDIKYIADMGRKQIVAYDQNNQFVKAYGGKNLFDKPLDVAVSNDRLYVADMNKHQVFILNKDTGRHIGTIGIEGGLKGKNEGEFWKPSFVTVDPAGHLYVDDSFNFRIQKFNADGEYISTTGFHSTTYGGLARPKGIAVDKNGNIYVADAAFENVQIFNADARLLLDFGGPGLAPGSMYLPAGVAVDYENVEYFSEFIDPEFKVEYLIYVCNSFGKNLLNVYGFGKWVGEALPE